MQDVLLAHTGHELRTPLQAIIGFTGTLLLRLPGPLNDEQERQLQLVQTSAEQLLSLINRLSRPSAAPRRHG
jgi:signal transduction histidine kinase